MSLQLPEKFPVKFYSWQDTDAPQLANIDGCIKTIIKACLVTGFGEKQGAGWTMLFDDSERMVLRRPLRTGNPPDIKIENGVINGTPSHRIVAQDNPTSLDDPAELSAVNILTKDTTHGQEWYFIASDFAFMLCYQMAENGFSNKKDNTHVLFVGSMKKLLASDNDYFFVNHCNVIKRDGTAGAWLYPILYHENYVTEMRRNQRFSIKHCLRIASTAETFTGDYFAQKVLLDKVAELPFFTSIATDINDFSHRAMRLNGRPMFRFVNKPHVQGRCVLYISLDYWEL